MYFSNCKLYFLLKIVLQMYYNWFTEITFNIYSILGQVIMEQISPSIINRIIHFTTIEQDTRENFTTEFNSKIYYWCLSVLSFFNCFSSRFTLFQVKN